MLESYDGVSVPRDMTNDGYHARSSFIDATELGVRINSTPTIRTLAGSSLARRTVPCNTTVPSPILASISTISLRVKALVVANDSPWWLRSSTATPRSRHELDRKHGTRRTRAVRMMGIRGAFLFSGCDASSEVMDYNTHHLIPSKLICRLDQLWPRVSSSVR